jgi:hypothetical protein
MQIIRTGAKGRLAIPAGLFYCCLLFILGIIPSFYGSAGSNAMRGVTQLLLFYFGLVLTYMIVDDTQDLRRMVLVMNIGLAMNALVGLFQSLTWLYVNGFVLIANGEWFRFSGLCASPADYVAFLTIGLLLAGCNQNYQIRRITYFSYSILLIFSMSRTALINLFIVGLIKLLTEYKGKKILYAAGILMLIMTIVFILNPDNLVLQRFKDIGNTDLNIKRMLVYEDVVNKIQASPIKLFIGHGFGTYSFFHPLDQELYNNTHNFYLYLLYSAGLIGFMTFVMVIAYLVTLNYRYQRKINKIKIYSFESLLTNAMIILHICIGVDALVENNINSVGQGWLLGSIFGLTLVLNRKNSHTGSGIYLIRGLGSKGNHRSLATVNNNKGR